MKTKSLLAVLLCVSIGSADLVMPRQRDVEQKLAGQRRRSYVESFKANERASVLVSGDGQSCLSVHIFDADGNCVAFDDNTEPKTADDLIAEWIPEEQARYSIEVRNSGTAANQFELAVR
jgi:hypothetical protein